MTPVTDDTVRAVGFARLANPEEAAEDGSGGREPSCRFPVCAVTKSLEESLVESIDPSLIFGSNGGKPGLTKCEWKRIASSPQDECSQLVQESHFLSI